MNYFGVTLLVTLVTGCLCAVPHKVDRVVDSHLSDKDPGTEDYDHEAFLGRDEAKTVASLTDDEKKEKLKIIFGKIDKDGSGTITSSELKDWISYTQQRYIDEDVDKQFPAHDLVEDGFITWDEYYKSTYGPLDDEDWQDGEDVTYNDMLVRDKKRWEMACKDGVEDEEGKKKCDKEHFKRFLHPEEYPDMKEVVLMETVDDLDKNKDGFVDLDEYITDMYKPETDGEEEPEWLKTERDQFHNYRDKDQDGKLSVDEVRNWILPEDYNHAEAESEHLIYESDDDQSKEVTLEEMIKHMDLYIGSQATDWGEALLRHEEL